MSLRDELIGLSEAVKEYRAALEALDDLGFGINESEMNVHRLSMAANALNDRHRTPTKASRLANHMAATAAKKEADKARAAGQEHKAAEFDSIHNHHMYHPVHGPMAGKKPPKPAKNLKVNAATAESAERWSRHARTIQERYGVDNAKTAQAHLEAAAAHLSVARYRLVVEGNSASHAKHTQKALSHLLQSQG